MIKRITRLDDGDYIVHDELTPIDMMFDTDYKYGNHSALKISLIRLIGVCLPGILMMLIIKAGITVFLMPIAFLIAGWMSSKDDFKSRFFAELKAIIVSVAIFVLLFSHIPS